MDESIIIQGSSLNACMADENLSSESEIRFHVAQNLTKGVVQEMADRNHKSQETLPTVPLHVDWLFAI